MTNKKEKKFDTYNYLHYMRNLGLNEEDELNKALMFIIDNLSEDI